MSAVKIEGTSQIPVGLQIKNTSVDAHVKKDVYSKYNFFVDTYNKDINRIGDTYLKKVRIWRLMNIECSAGACCLVCLSLIPWICWILLIVSIACVWALATVIHTVRKNRQAVKNPFANMIFVENSKNANDYYQISSVNQITEFEILAVNDDDFGAVAARARQNLQTGKSVEVMSYSKQFADYEKNVFLNMCGRMCGYCILVLLSTMMSYVSIIITVSIAYDN